MALFLIKLKPGWYKYTIQHKEILSEKGILVRVGGGGGGIIILVIVIKGHAGDKHNQNMYFILLSIKVGEGARGVFFKF